MAKIKVLKEHPLFRGFSDREIAVLSQIVGEKSFPKDTALFTEGMPGDSLFVLKSGTVAIRKRGASGKDEVLLQLGPGEIIGGLSLLEAGTRPCSAWTTDTVEVLTVAADDFQSLLEREPMAVAKLTLALARDVARKLRADLPALIGAGLKGSVK